MAAAERALLAEVVEKTRVLVVDDEEHLRKVWRRMLAGTEFEVVTAADGREALELVRAAPFHVAIVDLMMPGLTGMELLAVLKSEHPEIEVVIMTAFGGIATAVEAVKAGAHDFLTKPFASNDAAVMVVRKAAEHRRLLDRTRALEAALAVEGQSRELVGQSPRMREVLALVDSVAPTPTTVLIQGESVTAKELVARASHTRSPRRARPFVAVNCAALTETLLESELFGHLRGAFTGAIAEHTGLFVTADGGTLMLDEIGEIPPPLQAKLLRVLQEGEVRPVGATESRTVDVRLIAATNADLAERMRAGRFREDLYYRLNVVCIQLPSLRERPEDIPLLAHHFLAQHARRLRKRLTRIEPDALDALLAYRWPGNARELENAIERAAVLGHGGAVRLADLPAQLRTLHPADKAESPGYAHLRFAQARDLALTSFERRYAADLLRRAKGNVSEAARDAGLDRSNFKRILRRCGLDPEEFRE